MKQIVRKNVGVLSGAALLFGIAYGFTRKRKPFSFFNRVVVITGGSRGLGLVMARQFAEQGAKLVLLARKHDELTQAEGHLPNADVLSISCDLTKRDEVDSAIKRAAEHFGRIDVLINNAGIIQVGPLDSFTIEDFADAMAIHFFAPLYTTMAALPHLRAAGGGRIVNIASIGGKIAMPHLLPYSASKFALVGFSDGLRNELRRENIRVTTVCPGLMRTGSPPNAFFKGRHEAEYAWFSLGAAMPVLSINAERAAAKILRACQKGDARLVITPQAKAAVMMSELFPDSSAALMAAVNRILPEMNGEDSKRLRTGWECQSKWSPSKLTTLSDKAAMRNNQASVYALR